MPKELSKEQKSVIEKIASEHCNKTFGYLDQDDLKSEIWIICIQAIPEYNKKYGPLENFLRKTVKNRLVNKFKDITKSVRSPCPRCKYFNKENGTCNRFGEDKDKCNKWRNYQLSIISRNSLLNATEDQVERSYSSDVSNKAIIEEYKVIIIKNINKRFLNDFNQLVDGQKISGQRLERLRKEISRIIKLDIGEDRAL